MKNDNFKFYFPADIEKAKADGTGAEVMKFKGIASTNDKDSQGEFLDPRGFDLTEFKWVNWNHHGSKNPATIIGEPTKAQLNGKNELYIEGVLYPDVPMAQDAWNLMKALKNSPSGNKLSLSVEGKVIQRGCDPEFLDEEKKIKNPNFSIEKWNKVIKSKITGVALCPVPINGKTWADMITKGYSSTEDEEYDVETQQALITSVEQEEPSKLKKSEIYERIYDKCPNISIQKAKSIYLLIEKTANIMKSETTTASEISKETIEKAFEILNLADSAIEKGEDGKPITKQAPKPSSDDDEDEDEKEMVKKAKGLRKAMTADKKDDEVIKAALIKKGYGEKVIEKAMKAEEDAPDEKKEGLSKGDIAELLKSQSLEFGTQLKAVGTILKATLDSNAVIQKSLETTLATNGELKTQIENLSKQVPAGAKSMIVKSYTDRFGEEKAGTATGEKPKYNINSAKDRTALKDILTEKSGINKGENYDKGMIEIAQELEITKGVSDLSLRRLHAMEINIVAE